MTNFSRRYESDEPGENAPVETTNSPQIAHDPAFDPGQWHASHDEVARRGGRLVLGTVLAMLAAAWIGYVAWQAGRTLTGEALTSPAVAQWLAVAAGPLGLMGLVWLMFGRTRRKEAEQFTRSVVAMRTEANALQDVLAALSAQIDRNHAALGIMAGDLMGLGDQASIRLGAITADLDVGARKLAEHGQALDRAADAARTDIGVLLADLPVAEATALRMAEALRGAGLEASDQARAFELQAGTLTTRVREADAVVGEAAQRLVAHLTHIESASAAAATRLTDAGQATSESVDLLLTRSAEALDQIRAGIDTQATTVAALLAQSEAGIGRAGVEASQQLHLQVGQSNELLEALSQRIADQEQSSRRLVSELDGGLAALDLRFEQLAIGGDQRSQRISGVIAGLRADIAALGSDAGAHDQAILAIADRTQALRNGVGQLSDAINAELNSALGQAEDGAARLLATSSEAHPLIIEVRNAAVEAGERIAAGSAGIAAQHEALGALRAAVDDGVGGAEQKLGELARSISQANDDALRLSNETGPALVAALVQVREAAAHAAERARSAIAAVIPASASQLGKAAREALDRAIRETVEERLSEVDRIASQAIASARGASEQLAAQMLSIGHSATALDAHVAAVREAARRDGGEEFARHVGLLIDSMHSASIDVQKILSDEVDEKAWSNYLKGNRGVFTRRAVRLIGGSETRALQQHYDSDPEFQQSVNSYIGDFEAMLRRVMGERDGGMLAVTLMSSDMGKLYAALAQAIERRR